MLQMIAIDGGEVVQRVETDSLSGHFAETEADSMEPIVIPELLLRLRIQL